MLSNNTPFFLIAIFLISIELIISGVAPSLSGNISHIRKFPDIAKEIARKNENNAETILLLGNSLIDHAVNLEQFKSNIVPSNTSGYSVFKMVPDGTSIWDWYCIVKNVFPDSIHSPKTIIIGYAWSEVPPVPSRLAGNYCGLSDLSDLYELGMSSTSDVLEYLVAGVSNLYAMRETLRKRILDLVIPGYRVNVRKVNEGSKRNNVDSSLTTIAQQGSNLMDRFLGLLHERDIKLIFIAMPVVKDYLINENLVRTIRESGGDVYDYRHLDGITDSMYLDPIHLNERGRQVFTRKLSADIIQGFDS